MSPGSWIGEGGMGMGWNRSGGINIVGGGTVKLGNMNGIRPLCSAFAFALLCYAACREANHQ